MARNAYASQQPCTPPFGYTPIDLYGGSSFQAEGLLAAERTRLLAPDEEIQSLQLHTFIHKLQLSIRLTKKVELLNTHRH